MNKFLKISFFSVLLALPLMAGAQNISVASFKLLENDLTANTTGTIERDQNGEVAALIKVVTTEQGFVFDGGMTGIVKTKQGVGEIWVYVPHGIKRITVQHPQLGVLRDYYFPIAIEKGKTYELVLTTGKVETIVTRTVGKQYVMFTVSPTNAVVELDGMPLEVVDGYAEKSMAYGTYDYRVSCANYYTEAGKVTVSSQGKVEKKVTLRPNFGWMSFDGDEGSLGADVYVNGERMGQLPFTTKQLKSGRYQIRVAKSMYETYEAEVTVTDNESQQLYVQLKPNFGWIKFDAANEFHGAHVYINDERVGQLPLTTDRMTSGTYQIKVLKSLFKPYVNQVIVVDNATTSLNVKLVPNFANVTLVTDPEAEIWIDEKLKGKGKCTVELELGNYMVEVKRTSHRTISDVVTITDVAPRTIQLLSPTPIYGTLDVTSTPSRAIVYIDGVEVGETPLILNEVLVGSHGITLKKKGYAVKEEVVEFKFDEDNRFMFFMAADSQYDATEDSITTKRKQTQEKIDKSIKDSIDNVYKKEIRTTIKLYRKRNYADAFAEFLHYSEHNYYAQYYLGEMYYHGKGVSVDYAEALMWYEKAANQGYCDAQYKLAYCYEKGRGTLKNKKLALKWYRVAAEGNGRASYKAEMF